MSAVTDLTPPQKGVPVVRVLLLVLIAFLVGVLLTSGVALLFRSQIDGSRPELTLEDVVHDGVAGFANAPAPSGEACDGRRGCVEGVVGDGVAIYRFQSLDLARQYVIYSDADFYRSDRFVIEFEGTLTPDERFQLVQRVEGTWTGSDD